MRLIKFNDIIVNLDNIVMIKGFKGNGESIDVYLYPTNKERIYLGECKNENDYKEFSQVVYEGLLSQFPDEVISVDNICKDDDELWSNY